MKAIERKFFPTLHEGFSSGRMKPDYARLLRRARSVDDTDTIDKELAIPYLAREILLRVKNDYDNVIAITGKERIGKSVLALRLAQELNTGWTPNDICYSVWDVIEQYERAKAGTIILYDEAVRGLLATDTFTKEQKLLVQTLAMIGEKNCILFILAPSIWLIALQVGRRRANLWIHAKKRGLAEVYDRDDRLRFIPTSSLSYARNRIVPLLSWQKYEENDPYFSLYHTTKARKLQEYLAETKAKLGKKPTSTAHTNSEAP